MHPDTLTVNLGERSYPLYFSANPVDAVRKQVMDLQRAGRNVAVVTNRTVARVQREAFEKMFGKVGLVRNRWGDRSSVPMYRAPSGEGSKSLRVLGSILDFLAAQRLDRASALFVVGGGVVGDLGGFAAACYLRGIDYYQVPTTLLAMVDSSVGGKTGINLSAGKNLVGAFHQPRGVFIGTKFLATLKNREFAAGMAEVIKCGLLGNAALFNRLERAPLTKKSPGLTSIIRQCCALKARIVQADEREEDPNGGRVLLNLGHTFGHAIEQVAGYGKYLHGHAVAIGLVGAALLSERLGLIAPGTEDGGGLVRRVKRVLLAHNLPICLRRPLPLADLMAAMARDKKVRSGTLRFIVLRSAGEAAVEPRVDAALVEPIWRELGAL